jgi:hypothetical protein
MRPFPEASLWTFTLWAAGLCGCFTPFEVECGIDAHCNRFAGGLCHENPATGNQWCKYPDAECPSGYRYSDLDVGDGVSATCVADVDAPSRPIVENGQRADLVLGQEIFTTNDFNHGGVSGRSLFHPSGVSIDDETGRLWILDSVNQRALMWSPAPLTSFAEAALVVGQANLTSAGYYCVVGATTICPSNSNLAAKGGKLVIPDQCGVKIWNPGPVANGSAASIVLGQTSFNYCASGNGAADLHNPRGAWTDGTRVVIADTLNSRILIWTSFPTTNKQPADLVLGQPGFGMSGCQSSPTDATMCAPQSVYSDGMRLFVADTLNHRVLMWRSFPTTSGQPADFAIGQPDLAKNGDGRGASQLAYPRDVTTVGDHLLVADSGNHRVLVFSPIPTASGASASFVLGQPNFEMTSMGTTQQTFNTPVSLAVGGNKLYVTDQKNSRVLRFDLKL